MNSGSSNFKQVIEGIKCLVIPPYQRPYKWTKEKRQELWYDILTQYDKTKDVIGQKNSVSKLAGIPTHYMGTLVFAGPSQIGGVSTSEVIDGQQRLTTLVTLLAAIRDAKINYKPRKEPENKNKKKKKKKASKTNTKENKARSEFETFNNTFFVNASHRNSERMYRLYLQEEDRGALEAVISRTKHEVSSPTEKSLVYESYRYFQRAINKGSEDFEVDDPFSRFQALFPLNTPERLNILEQIILTRLTFIHIETASADDTNSIFESLNAKNEQLEPIELIRNYYYMLLGRETANDEMSLYWGKVRKALPKDKIQEEFIWAYYNSRGSYAMQKKVYSLVKSELLASGARNDPEVMRDHLKSIAEWAPIYAELEAIKSGAQVNGFTNFKKEEAAAISRVFQAGGSTCMSFFLWLVDLKRAAEIDSGEFVLCASYLESYMVRRFLGAQAANNLNISNAEVLKKLSSLKSGSDYPSILRSSLIDSKLEWPTDDKLLELMKTAPFYTNGLPGPRYFILGELDRRLTGDATTKDYTESKNSIEHIIPQSAKDNPDWVSYLSPHVKNLDSFLENKLDVIGNLTIVTHRENSCLGDKPIEAKLKIYEASDSEYMLTKKSGEWIRQAIIEHGCFADSAVTARTEWIHEMVCKRWQR